MTRACSTGARARRIVLSARKTTTLEARARALLGWHDARADWFLLRSGALCYPECASDAKAPPAHLAAPEEVRTGVVNWTGVFNEFLQSRYNLDVGSPIFSETYASAGPAHRLHHRCSLTVNSADMGLHHVVTGAYCANGACALHHPSRRSPAHDSTLPRRTDAA